MAPKLGIGWNPVGFPFSQQVPELTRTVTNKTPTYECLIDGQQFLLFDMPGFDDIYRLDADIPQELAGNLAASYKNNLKLGGVVYLHRIKDERMTNAIMRNLTMFKNPCGDSGLENTILATTFWDELPYTEKGEQREKELANNAKYWGYMLSKGASPSFASSANPHPSLASRYKYDEMAVRGYGINETKAGETLNVEIAKLKQQHFTDMARLKGEMEEARRSGEIELQETLQQLQKEKELQVNRLLNEQEAMKADRREEMRQLTQDFNDRISRLEMERRERDFRVQQLEENLTGEKADSGRPVHVVAKELNEVMWDMTVAMEHARLRDKEAYETKLGEMMEQKRSADREIEEWREEVRMLNGRIAQLAAAYEWSGRAEKMRIEAEIEELEGKKESWMKDAPGVLGGIATVGFP